MRHYFLQDLRHLTYGESLGGRKDVTASPRLRKLDALALDITISTQGAAVARWHSTDLTG